jgi:ubiquinone/menaquinone biosynthesis C-methylase UbiE
VTEKEKQTMDYPIEIAERATAPAPATVAQTNKPTHAQFVGSIPQIYDEHLGPLLFEFAAKDLAGQVRETLPGAGRVLEVACGTGILTHHLSQALSLDTEIVATDLNDAMLAFAKQKRGGALTNVAFQQADAQALPYCDDEFDAVICQFGLMFFPDKAEAMSGFARVLRPGGLLAFNVWGSLENNRVADITHKTIASFFATDPPDFLTVPFGYYEIDPIRDLIQGAGLEVLDVDTVSATIERPDALSVARGFVEGNPGILQIRERASADPEDIVHAVADAISDVYGQAPLQFPLQEIVFLAGKP